MQNLTCTICNKTFLYSYDCKCGEEKENKIAQSMVGLHIEELNLYDGYDETNCNEKGVPFHQEFIDLTLKGPNDPYFKCYITVKNPDLGNHVPNFLMTDSAPEVEFFKSKDYSGHSYIKNYSTEEKKYISKKIELVDTVRVTKGNEWFLRVSIHFEDHCVWSIDTKPHLSTLCKPASKS